MSKLLLYCTKANRQKDLLWSNDLKRFFLDGAYNRLIDNLPNYLLNGKIVAECDFEIEEIIITERGDYNYDCFSSPEYCTSTLSEEELCEKSCLYIDDIDEYLDLEKGYAIHIKNLHIFDEPKELSEFYKIIEVDEADFNENDYKYVPITKAPQNMMYAYRLKSESMYDECNFIGYDYYVEEYTLISIQPQWLCKILNGEKTIEIRKKVLKEMIK